jgi:hypothetical protein
MLGTMELAQQRSDWCYQAARLHCSPGMVLPNKDSYVYILTKVSCRVGEKFIQWTDKTPPIDDILDSVTLYWFTESFPRAIYGYRQFFDNPPQ